MSKINNCVYIWTNVSKLGDCKSFVASILVLESALLISLQAYEMSKYDLAFDNFMTLSLFCFVASVVLVQKFRCFAFYIVKAILRQIHTLCIAWFPS